MPFARASELDRLLACPGSAYLPRAPDRPIEAGQWGRMVHRWKATGAVEPEPEWPNHGPLLADRLTRVSPNRGVLWPGAETGHEVAVALCAETGTAASFSGTPAASDAWKAALPPSFISGTADWRGWVLETLWIDDLKTGREPPPPDSAQLLFYALAAARTEWPVPSRVLLSITHWPRYPRDGAPTREWVTVTAAELDAFEARLRALHRAVADFRGRVPGATTPGVPPPSGETRIPKRALAQLNPGPVCTYCPSRPHCPKGDRAQ